MEQIIITRADNTTWSLITKSAVTNITKAEQRRTLLGEDIISMTVESSVTLTFAIKDHITIFGSTYYLNALPKYKKSNSRKHTYDLVWEGLQYNLIKPLYLDAGVDGVSISPDFSLTGDLEFLLGVLINNANRVFGAGVWVLGDCPETDYRTFTFSNETCLAVLQRLCKPENYNKEFEITENNGVYTLDIVTAVGTTHSEVYEYGKTKGLCELTRETVSNKDVITRLYVFGSNKNLASDYRGFSQRLKLPYPNDLSYIENAGKISSYGLIEGVKIFEEIYPHRTGEVSSLGSGVLEFIDSSMDFDLNEEDEGNTLYLISGVTARVHFNTGKLAGYDFALSSYDHNTKKFTIQSFTDERGQVFPDENTEAFQIEIGDKYVLLDIRMPQSYITAAETALDTAGDEYYDLVSQPRVQYSQVFDEMYFIKLYQGQSVQNVFDVGDNVHIKDTDIGVDKSIRLRSFRRDIIHPYRYALDLYDYSEESLAQKLVTANNEVSKIIASSGLNDSSIRYGQYFIDSLSNCLIVMQAGTPNAYLRIKYPIACDGEVQAFSDNGQLPADIWESLPIADGNTFGISKIGSGISAVNGVISVNAFVPLTQKGAASGVAELDSGGKVPASQLPGFIDVIIEVANYASLPVTGESGKIYITLDTGTTYRWGGTVYIEISASLSLGETSSTAYRGDRGKTAYDHSQASHQTIINGTGFVVASGTSLSYDNNTYSLSSHNHSGTYLPTSGAGDIYTHSASEFATSGHNHTGVYDPAGTGHSEASAHVTAHENTYNHGNYNTAYSHASLITGNPHGTTYAEVSAAPNPHDNTYHSTAYLATNETAYDSDKLDGEHGSYYAPINSPTFTGSSGPYLIGYSGGWAREYGFKGTSSTDLHGFGALGYNDSLSYYYIGTYNAEKLVVLPGGNVGIGNTSPDYLLDVGNDTTAQHSYIKTNSPLAWENGYIWASAGTNKWIMYKPSSSTDLRIVEAGSGDRVTFQSGGNVGIGTTAPDCLLHIRKDGSAGGIVNLLILENRWSTNSGGVGIFFKGYYNHALISSYENANNTVGGNLQFQTYNEFGNLNTGMVLDRIGRLGIGTTTPLNLVDIKVATNQHIGFRQANSYASLGTFNDAGNAFVRFDIDALTLSLNAYSSGNVGIGTAAPYGLLQLGAGTYGATGGGYNHFHAGAFGVLFRDANDSYIAGNCYYGSSGWTVKYDTYKSVMMRMYDGAYDWYTGSGSTAGAAATLTVKMTLTNAGALQVLGEVTAYYSSDERLKSNIKSFSALDIINKIKPVLFNWNDKAKELNSTKDDRNNYGIVAQELESVLPELIHPIYDKYKAVDYVQLVPILIQAVKELKSEIKQLRNGSGS